MSDIPAVKRQTLRKMFFTGILFLFPIGVTFWLLDFLVSSLQGYTRPMVGNLLNLVDNGQTWQVPNWAVTLVSLLVAVVFVMLIGWLANFYLGKKILNFVDITMLKLPFVRSIYGGTKQIIDAFSMQRSSGSFKKVVLLEYPRKECWVLGFVTNEHIEKSDALFGRELAAVFVPSTPNPTTGFLLYLDPSELYIVDLDVEAAVKLIVSAGLVIPSVIPKKPTTLGEELEEKKAKAIQAQP